jgi:hypothetical protein
MAVLLVIPKLPEQGRVTTAGQSTGREWLEMWSRDFAGDVLTRLGDILPFRVLPNSAGADFAATAAEGAGGEAVVRLLPGINAMLVAGSHGVQEALGAMLQAPDTGSR